MMMRMQQDDSWASGMITTLEQELDVLEGMLRSVPGLAEVGVVLVREVNDGEGGPGNDFLF